MKAYDTLSEAIAGLKNDGYSLDFNIAFDKIECVQNGICLNPEQFEITDYHRFEGNSDPADESVVYTVESHDGKMKGLLVNGYGVSAADISDELLRKLSVQKQ
ncbi:phosphoribosylpyrophosphate synthetase [Pollutibacter soli]|uniref:phosphoribosylpyrophosphate synthetase n=1 Tax=Pollutibacter soli TaxID=3034157 RepID=UPI003014006E